MKVRKKAAKKDTLEVGKTMKTTGDKTKVTEMNPAPGEAHAKKEREKGAEGKKAVTAAAQRPGIRKEPSTSRDLCRVTFRLPMEAVLNARRVTLVGDFNNWDKDAAPLVRQDNGDFVLTLELNAGREYRFRYFIDGNRWENDWAADKYVRSPYGSDDSVVCV